MALKPTSRRPVGKQPVTPRRPGKGALPPMPALPEAGDAATRAAAAEPDPLIVQARLDLDAGQVDTDMHATPGLDAQRRALLVPGPGGQPLRAAAAAPALRKPDGPAEALPPRGQDLPPPRGSARVSPAAPAAVKRP